jgi:uncharacterized protein (TIGR02246 family)
MSPSTDVRTAVRDLVAALDRHDTDALLAAMAPDVTYLLAGEDTPLRSREELRAVVDGWAGPAVEAVHSWDLEIRELGPDLATASHVLSIHLAGVPSPIRRRETLVLARSAQDGRWLVVQGHRSAAPYEWSGARVPPTHAPLATA